MYSKLYFHWACKENTHSKGIQKTDSTSRCYYITLQVPSNRTKNTKQSVVSEQVTELMAALVTEIVSTPEGLGSASVLEDQGVTLPEKQT